MAAALNSCIVIFLLVLPLLAGAATIVNEGTKLYSFLFEWITETNSSPLESILNMPVFAWILSVFPELKSLPMWKDLAYNGASVIASVTTDLSREIVGNALRVAFNLLVITVASFFMTRDGHLFIGFIRDLLPLGESAKDDFFLRGKRMLYAIFYGVILTAAIQGALGGLGWWFVGLGSPVFFGSLMFILAILPFVGTPIVWGPGVIYLFAHGDTKSALTLLIWGLVIVSSIDNLLRPFFISGGSKAHVLLVFVGILGGLATWGFLGLFLGPLVLTLAVFFLQTYRLLLRTNAPLDAEDGSVGEKEEEGP